jgi:NADH-quinone oxidoreductase subunit N
MGKFFVFKSAWDAVPNLRWLVIAAIINSIISIYYYLYPIVVMFFRPLPQGFVKPRASGAMTAVLIITLMATFYLGLLPNGVLGLLGGESGKMQVEAQQVSGFK